MNKEYCLTVSYFADFFPPSMLMVLMFLTHNEWIFGIVGCLVFAYIFFFIPIKVCFTTDLIVIKTITGFQKKAINWDAVQSLTIVKSAQPSIPLQFFVDFDSGKGIKNQSFGLNQESKIIEIIKLFRRKNILIESDGHGLIEYYMEQAKNENSD